MAECLAPGAPNRYLSATVMDRAIIVRGQMSGSRLIELDEPLDGMAGEVEVIVRAVAHAPAPRHGLEDVLRALPEGSRSQVEIDAELGAERAELALVLWESLDHAAKDAFLALSESDRAELGHRLAEHEAAPETAIPWGELRASLSPNE
jgi:putative addiction module component (TIGR02574 family)